MVIIQNKVKMADQRSFINISACFYHLYKFAQILTHLSGVKIYFVNSNDTIFAQRYLNFFA